MIIESLILISMIRMQIASKLGTGDIALTIWDPHSVAMTDISSPEFSDIYQRLFIRYEVFVVPYVIGAVVANHQLRLIES